MSITWHDAERRHRNPARFLPALVLAALGWWLIWLAVRHV